MAQPLAAPYCQFFDDNGDPLNGGFVYTYAAGTDTPQDSYTDYTGGTPAANPVELDSEGRAEIWLQGYYKIKVTDANAVVIRTVDNITAIGATGDMNTSVYDAANVAEQLVGRTAVQTLTNKTLTDSSTTFADNSDSTKKFAIQCSGITTANTRTMTVPDADFTAVGLTTTQSITNKTFDVTNIDTGYTITTAQADLANSTSITAVAGLNVSIAASAKYVFEAHLTVTCGAAGGIKVAIDTPAAPTSIAYTAWNYNGTTLNACSKTTSAAGEVGGATAVSTNVIIKGVIQNGSTAGTLRVFFAQNASNGTNTSVLINSFFWVKRVA